MIDCIEILCTYLDTYMYVSLLQEPINDMFDSEGILLKGCYANLLLQLQFKMFCRFLVDTRSTSSLFSRIFYQFWQNFRAARKTLKPTGNFSLSSLATWYGFGYVLAQAILLSAYLICKRIFIYIYVIKQCPLLPVWASLR